MPEKEPDGKQKTDAKSLNQILMPVLIGVVSDTLIGAIETLTPSMRLLSVLLIGLVYGGLTNGFGIKQPPLSRRMAFILTILFIISGVLIIFASVILNLDLMQTAVLLGCLAVMGIALWVSKSLPESFSLLRSALSGAATVGLGASLAIGGAPVVDFVTSPSTDAGLTIINDCDTPLISADLNLNVAAHGRQNLTDVPAISFSLERRGDELVAGGLAASLVRKTKSKMPFSTSIDGCKKISVDGQLLKPDSSIELRMYEKRNHTILIDCSACH